MRYILNVFIAAVGFLFLCAALDWAFIIGIQAMFGKLSIFDKDCCHFMFGVIYTIALIATWMRIYTIQDEFETFVQQRIKSGQTRREAIELFHQKGLLAKQATEQVLLKNTKQ